MKLTSITVGNFKNIAETKLSLGAIIAVVSPNNYGKSNLLEAIQFGFDFIAASARSRLNMMHWTRGIPLSPSLAGKDYVFAIEFDDPELGEYRYVRYSFHFSWFNDNGEDAAITEETIEIRASERVRYTAYLKRNKGQYRAEKSKGFRKISLSRDILAIDILSSLDDIDISDVVSRIKSLSIRMCNTLELDRSFRPNPIEFASSESSVMFDDDDIPKALNLLRKRDADKFDLFIEMVYDLFPEFENITLQSYALKDTEKPYVQAFTFSPSGKRVEADKIDVPYHIKGELYRLVISSRFLNQPISMEYMSTGTKRIIWLLANAVFGNCYGTSLIGVDEIETSIHPKMIRILLESLASVLDDTSMIVTSHSPYLIQYLKPEYIYIGVPKEDGVAEFKRIHSTKVKTLLNNARKLGTSLGEYLFELMSGDEDSASILAAYLEE